MAFRIPSDFLGKPIQGAMSRVLNLEKKDDRQVDSSIPGDLTFLTEIVTENPREYIQVPQKNIVIALRETDKGLQYVPALTAVLSRGLFAPRVDQFMTHRANVKEAAEGKRTLLYADGTPVSTPDTRELWEYMSSTNRTNRGVCWTWLDALFKCDPQGKLYMETDHRLVPGGLTLAPKVTRVSLSSYLEVNGAWADLSLNAEGLPTRASSSNSYNPASNIYFWQPTENKVARFGADSGWASLSCDGDPSYSNPQLGVRAVRAKN